MMSPARRLSDRHPFEIYLLLWCFFASVPGAVGLTDLPKSVLQQVPYWVGRVWVTALAVGCLIALVGLAWHRPPYPKVSVTGLLWEHVGLTVVGWAALFYSTAALFSAGLSALAPVGIILAFGLACFAQSFKILGILGRSPRWLIRLREVVLRRRPT